MRSKGREGLENAKERAWLTSERSVGARRKAVARILSDVTVEGWWFLGGVATLVIFVLVEGRRQTRRHGPPSRRPNLLGVGMLDVQRHLQADRHVEMLQKLNKTEQEEVEQQDIGAGRTTERDRGQ